MQRSRPLLLMVDDVSKNLQVLGSFLREAEYDISAAISGKQALTIAAELHPDLILLDIMMPELDGFETCRRLKENPETADIPVIFLTARTDAEDIIKGFSLGAIDYVTKPFHRQELLARVATHLALRRSQEELRQTIRDKDKFFSIIAHDLRGPLGSFMSIAEYVSENLTDLDIGDVQTLFREMQQTGKSVYVLLENLLEWSRIQLGTIQFTPDTFDISTVMERTYNLLRSQAEQKQITLKVDLASIDVYADRNMISTVLRNLISNAVKYTARDGRISVTMMKRSDEGRLYISVQDSGVGMDEKRLAGLFDITKTKSTPGTEKERGSGLGLILCRELVGLHGQELRVESEKGEGSTFTFTLALSGGD
ncbi:MAG: hybrid sensor histidine kinase/response regulator [Bacteroidota bacterium]|nr:hybrid sensor histidine kinase/response regulator [Bacteroidota bacterium]